VAPESFDLAMTSAVIAVVAIAVLILLALRLLWNGSNRVIAEDYSRLYGSPARLVSGFREICRTVLDPNVLTFLTENAPTHVTISFRMRQQQLSRFSLLVASDTLFQRLVDKGDRHSRFSLRRSTDTLLFQIENWFLLVACGFAQASLMLSQSLSYWTPRRAQLWVQVKVLSGVAGMLGYFAPDTAQDIALADRKSEALASNLVSDRNQTEDLIVDDVRKALLTTLPNDLSRMICLATLRDNNTGGYYHPELARTFSGDVSDRALLACHQALYERLVSLSLEDLTDQLDIYFATTGSKARSIEYWGKLRAYRATIPIGADPISAEILFMKVEVALAILAARVSLRT